MVGNFFPIFSLSFLTYSASINTVYSLLLTLIPETILPLESSSRPDVIVTLGWVLLDLSCFVLIIIYIHYINKNQSN